MEKIIVSAKNADMTASIVSFIMIVVTTPNAIEWGIEAKETNQT